MMVLVSYATGQQEETLVCDKRDGVISCVLCCDLHLALMFFSLLQKDLAKSYFKQNYCHECHTMFAAFSPLPSCCLIG